MHAADIDTAFDFTTDTPGYWEKFRQSDCKLGGTGCDPDADSKTLRLYHKLLWSRPLPNGECMNLSMGSKNDYLTWNGFRFGSDSITASFRYKRYQYMITQAESTLPDFRSYVENFIRKTYTIGGTIIFPKRRGGINPSRGVRYSISDRWDLTLECIRRYYAGENSPLYDVLLQDKAFFDLFVNFKGYVDFFFLQDCVTSDYSAVEFWSGDGSFVGSPLPQTVSEYLSFIERELIFVEKRNARISAFVNNQLPLANPVQSC